MIYHTCLLYTSFFRRSLFLRLVLAMFDVFLSGTIFHLQYAPKNSFLIINQRIFFCRAISGNFSYEILTFDFPENKNSPRGFCRAGRDVPAGQSIIFRFELEISLRMLAHRADFRRALAYHDVAAVGALPDHIAVAGEDEAAFHIGEQLAVTLFVFFFDLADRLEQVCEMVEALFLRFLCHAVVQDVYKRQT